MALEGLYFDDFSSEKIFTTHNRTVTETDLVNFISQCGFYESLFMDQRYVETKTAFGKPIVPGALTFAYAEGLTILSGILHHTGMAFLGMEMQVLKPVFVGDTIGVQVQVIEKKETQKADRGIVTFLHRVSNQKGETVMEYKIKRMIRRKTGSK
jgi:acyl dehydratase